mmetsp:Transcript_15614/g.25713  ORF Transcript_15614/g.25713 Transcript_15614/m.25713 type:complete len:215 (+) Transcript_15614:972-1616(+)
MVQMPRSKPAQACWGLRELTVGAWWFALYSARTKQSETGAARQVHWMMRCATDHFRFRGYAGCLLLGPRQTWDQIGWGWKGRIVRLRRDGTRQCVMGVGRRGLAVGMCQIRCALDHFRLRSYAEHLLREPRSTLVQTYLGWKGMGGGMCELRGGMKLYATEGERRHRRRVEGRLGGLIRRRRFLIAVYCCSHFRAKKNAWRSLLEFRSTWAQTY